MPTDALEAASHMRWYMKMPCLWNYWRQKKRLFKTEFGAIMTKDHFLMIWRYLHVANNGNADPATPD
ncbi:hypothetical protein PoB_006605700 [Plakobranchus ocellatus]|uniref:PiggyBac transposable element-derived protein domain-containing protein n=1 Tax=Plakobranchus ocellatus TaxID=259542 RepID=A0AAV4D5X8_9GAST|nr:hypothetical protein PoB_006605700 [Plakobranchus ocellatus]